MKAPDLIDEQSAELLGFPWLRTALAPVSAYGARRFAELRPYRLGEERAAQDRAREVASIAGTLAPERVGASRATLASLPDVAAVVARATMDDLLDDPDFFELAQLCDGVERLEGVANAATRSVAATLAPGRREGGAFYLADAFDPTLAGARIALRDVQAELDAARGRERAEAARALERDEIAGDEFIVMRADLHGGPPPGVRVQREAATYLLCTLEYGAASLAALERREAAVAAVAAAEENVRRRLSSAVRESAGGLAAANDALARLDETLAAVRFTQRYGCTAAEIVAESALAIDQARFPPLEDELERAGRRFVPVTVQLDAPAVLTGPNMGGKSVAMQTCGFIALAAAFGLPVPAAHARVALFDQIAWLGVGREERPTGLLSSFAAELMALNGVLERRAQRPAIFVDEFARTTSPAEGIALAVALLERLREAGACGLAATHLPGIAEAAGVRHFAVRSYVIAEVDGDEQVSGDAIALAESLGMDERFVAAAYRALKGTTWTR